MPWREANISCSSVLNPRGWPTSATYRFEGSVEGRRKHGDGPAGAVWATGCARRGTGAKVIAATATSAAASAARSSCRRVSGMTNYFDNRTFRTYRSTRRTGRRRRTRVYRDETDPTWDWCAGGRLGGRGRRRAGGDDGAGRWGAHLPPAQPRRPRAVRP